MNVTRLSIIKFEISFTIPRNTVFNKITISDPLVTGLSFNESALVYIDNSNTPTTDDIIDNSTSDTFDLELGLSIATSPTSDRKVKVVLSVIIDDFDAIYSTINNAPSDPNSPVQILTVKNVATIKAFDVNDPINPISEITTDVPLNFTPYILYGFGSSYTIDKVTGETAYLVASIHGVDSFANDNLVYRIVIDTNQAFDISGVNDSNIIISVKSNNYSVSNSDILVNPDKQFIMLEFPHTDIMKNSIIYISVPIVSNPDIYDVNTEFIINDAIAYLYDFGGGPVRIMPPPEFEIPEEDILSVSSLFDIRINLVATSPKISDATKFIL